MTRLVKVSSRKWPFGLSPPPKNPQRVFSEAPGGPRGKYLPEHGVTPRSGPPGRNCRGYSFFLTGFFFFEKFSNDAPINGPSFVISRQHKTQQVRQQATSRAVGPPPPSKRSPAPFRHGHFSQFPRPRPLCSLWQVSWLFLDWGFVPLGFPPENQAQTGTVEKSHLLETERQENFAKPRELFPPGSPPANRDETGFAPKEILARPGFPKPTVFFSSQPFTWFFPTRPSPPTPR